MTNDLILAEIAATADAIRDAGRLIHATNRLILEPKPTYTTCTGYYNDGPCAHCEGN